MASDVDLTSLSGVFDLHAVPVYNVVTTQHFYAPTMYFYLPNNGKTTCFLRC